MLSGIPGSWAWYAACKGQTRRMEVDRRRSRELTAAKAQSAKLVCDNCPVFDQCRAWALQPDDPVPFHVAGGLTPWERTHLRRRVA